MLMPIRKTESKGTVFREEKKEDSGKQQGLD